MEYVDAGIVGHDLFGVGKGVQQELVESGIFHIVIFDFPGCTLIVNIIRGIGDRQVGQPAAHEQLVGFSFGAVPADQAMFSQQPQVARFGQGWLLQFPVYIEVIVFYTFLHIAGKQIIDLFGIKAGEGYIEITALQVRDEQGQLVSVPVTADLVQRDVQSFFLV